MKTKFKLGLLTMMLMLSTNVRGQDIDNKNPALIAGSSFGNIFQMYYKIGDYDALLKLTSDSSKVKYGSSKILSYYRTMEFGYSFKLKSWNRSGNIYNLNYQAKITATNVMIHMTVVVNNRSDSVKLVLPDRFWQQRVFLYK